MSTNLNDSSDAAVQFAESTSSLHRLLECPVCLDVSKTPVRTCPRGHITCSSCADKSASKLCSVCQYTFLEHSPACINSVLEALPYFCRYADAGCKEVIARGNDHELFCGFRTFKCRETGCEEEVQVQDAEEHYAQEHLSNACTKTKDGILDWVASHLKEKKTYDEPVVWDGHFGYISFDNSSINESLKVTYQVFPVGKAKKDVFLRVEFKTKKFLFASTMKPTIMKGEGESKSCDSEIKYDAAEYCLRVPQIHLSKFLDDTDKAIYFEYFESD